MGKVLFGVVTTVLGLALAPMCIANEEVETPLERVTRMLKDTPKTSPFHLRLQQRLQELAANTGEQLEQPEVCPLTQIILPKREWETDLVDLESFEALRMALVGFDRRDVPLSPEVQHLRARSLRSLSALIANGKLSSSMVNGDFKIVLTDVVFYAANGMLFGLMTAVEDRPSEPFQRLEDILMYKRFPMDERLRLELLTAMYAGAGSELFAMFPTYFSQRIEFWIDAMASAKERFVPQYASLLRGEIGKIRDPAGVYPNLLKLMSSDRGRLYTFEKP